MRQREVRGREGQSEERERQSEEREGQSEERWTQRNCWSRRRKRRRIMREK